ncbi:SCO family protein [Fimbriimonas ginsengisoli]|uniref:Electron transport protein SCO1/SenC n=1 Tax=Fimbriimonas ginsengisoli Gsoil 348 TaxID=661478 RepID=A0A068NQJ9_FIMGI|nr:SCO family protein [Fimbriimonas ginsengisoli]AIE85701.1 electron transport protein SCO1/SenC [Fimbriimonas ginsengisoli Gsoil 348]
MRPRVLLALLGLLPALAAAQTDSQIAVNAGTISRTIDHSKVRIDQSLGAQVPLDASFLDRTGKTVAFGDLLAGKPALVLPIFYKCKGICGLELQGAIAAIKGLKQSRLGRDFNVIVLSIHPKETPDLAQGKYASTIDEVALPGTEGGWRFLVGDWANIHKVTDTLGFKYTYNEAKDAIDHPSGVMFVTPQGVVSSYIYGAVYTPEQFERNFAIAGHSKVGAKAQEIFFGCIHLDPLTGKRSLVVQNVIKVAGAATVLTLGLSIFVLSGKARFRKRKPA